jgi:hypothetical protein
VNDKSPLRTALALTLTAGVCAGAAPKVRLSERGCSAYDRARLDELIAIELETVESDREARPSDVVLECRDGIVSIQASLRGTMRQRKSRVDPKAMDRAAATRLLALAITELLSQLWSDAPEKPAPAKSQPQPAPLPPAERRDASLPASADENEHRWGVFVGGVFRSMLEPRAGLFGGSARAEYETGSLLAVALDLEVAHGSVQSEHADVDVLLASAALYAPIGARLGQTALGVGPGVRAGWVNLSPSRLAPGAVGSDVSGAWAGPLLIARAKWSSDAWAVFAGLEGGLVTLPVVGTLNGGAAEVELRGAWLAASVGVGANL